MIIGNKPKDSSVGIVGKTYWWLSVGNNLNYSRHFADGWNVFEFVVLQPYPADRMDGEAMRCKFRVAFAFWLPIYFF